MTITSRNRTQNYCYCAMMAAIISVTAYISIPMPIGVPITLQTFAIALSGYALGWKYGGISVAIYLALGAVGVPVFAGGKGGIGVFLGYTGGFLWGFLVLVGLCGFSLRFFYHRLRHIILPAFGILGLLICHCFGVMQYSAISARGFFEGAMLVSVPFLPKDIVSIFAAIYISAPIRKVIATAKNG